MGIGASILLMAVGAVLTFAIEVDTAEWFNLGTIGIILMIVGTLGLIAAMTITGPWTEHRDIRD